MVGKVMIYSMLIFSQIYQICLSTSNEFQSMLSLLTETYIFIMLTLMCPRAKTKSTRKGYGSFLYSTWDATEGFQAETSFMCSRLPSRGGSFAFADCKGSLGERVSYASVHPPWVPRAGLILPRQDKQPMANPFFSCWCSHSFQDHVLA